MWVSMYKNIPGHILWEVAKYGIIHTQSKMIFIYLQPGNLDLVYGPPSSPAMIRGFLV